MTICLPSKCNSQEKKKSHSYSNEPNILSAKSVNFLKSARKRNDNLRYSDCVGISLMELSVLQLSELMSYYCNISWYWIHVFELLIIYQFIFSNLVIKLSESFFLLDLLMIDCCQQSCDIFHIFSVLFVNINVNQSVPANTITAPIQHKNYHKFGVRTKYIP